MADRISTGTPIDTTYQGVDSPGDPPCHLDADVYTPVGSGPWTYCVLSYGAVFRSGQPATTRNAGLYLSGNDPNFSLPAGITPMKCLSPFYRMLDAPAPGQTTSGIYPQQCVDVIMSVDFARAQSDCNGMVVGIGGSSGAHHLSEAMASGKLDCFVGLSGSYDMADRTPDPGLTKAVGAFAQYCNCAADDLITMAADSPKAHFLLENLCPSLVYRDVHDTMPVGQHLAFIAAMQSLGYTNFTAKEITTAGMHSFKYWRDVQEEVANFIFNALFTTGGGGGGGGGLVPYTAILSTPSLPDQTFTVPRGDPGQTTLPLNGVAASSPYTLRVWTNNEAGQSETPAIASFISDPPSSITPKSESRGVFTLLTGQASGEDLDLSNLTIHPWWQYDHIKGLRFRTGWNFLEETQGVIDFSGIDEALALCEQYDKNLSLSVAAGIKHPLWLEATDAVFFTETGPDAGTLAVPWDTTFLSYWDTLITALGARYDNNPRLTLNVIGGLGQVIETYLAKVTTEADTLRTLALSAGYQQLDDAFVDAGSSILDIYSRAFPSTAIITSVGAPYPAPFGNPYNNYEAMVNARANSTQIGYMQAGLNPNSNANFALNALVLRNSPTHPAGFQWLAVSTTEVDFKKTGQNGITLGAHFLEVYEPNAKSTDPLFIADMQQFNIDLSLNGPHPA